MNKLNHFNVVAHRGDPIYNTENTPDSIISAIRKGAKFVEIDVQFSGDLIPYVHHDVDLNRIVGIDGVIPLSWSVELDRYITRLSDISAVLQHFPGVTLFVEVKKDSIDILNQNAGVDLRSTLINHIAFLLRDVIDRVVIISFDYHCINACIAANVRSGWVIDQVDQVSEYEASLLNCEYVFINHNNAGQSIVGKFKQTTVGYETSDVELAQILLDNGFDMVETNDVGLLLGDELDPVL